MSYEHFLKFGMNDKNGNYTLRVISKELRVNTEPIDFDFHISYYNMDSVIFFDNNAFSVGSGITIEECFQDFVNKNKDIFCSKPNNLEENGEHKSFKCK